MNLLLIFLFLIIHTCQAQYSSPAPEITATNTERKMLEDKLLECDNILKLYDKDHDLNHLIELERTSTRYIGKDVFAQQKRLEYHLILLNRFAEAKDKSYDLKNPESITYKVVPPFDPEIVTMPGMDPKLINNPELRNKYEKDIASNKVKILKYEREFAIQQKLSSLMLKISIDMDGYIMTNDDITRRIAINNINNIIKVKYIKDMLFDLIKKREQYFIKMGIVHK